MKPALKNVVTIHGTPYTFPSAPKLGDTITTSDGQKFTLTKEFIDSLEIPDVANDKGKSK